MKRSLLALAVLGAFAGAASAQSTVTLYGRVDLSFAKNIGSENKDIQNGSGSRLGVRGVEDLGGGLKALFNIEHRFQADNGVASPAIGATAAGPRFWHGRSIVGLEGGFGRVWLGREYTPVFLTGTLLADPWGYDTVAAQGFLSGAIEPVRRDNSVNYQIGFGGFTFWGQIAEGTAGQPDRPYGMTLTYGAGPLYVALGYDNPEGQNDNWLFLTANYDFGGFKLFSGFGTGDANDNATHRAFTIGATMPIGGGELRVAHGQLKRSDAPVGSALGNIKVNQKTSLGYHYALSKRTTVYADVSNDRGDLITTERTGYDVGIKHNF